MIYTRDNLSAWERKYLPCFIIAKTPLRLSIWANPEIRNSAFGKLYCLRNVKLSEWISVILMLCGETLCFYLCLADVRLVIIRTAMCNDKNCAFCPHGVVSICMF